MPCATRRRIAGRAESRSVEVMMGGAVVVVSSRRPVGRAGWQESAAAVAAGRGGQRSSGQWLSLCNHK